MGLVVCSGALCQPKPAFCARRNIFTAAASRLCFCQVHSGITPSPTARRQHENAPRQISAIHTWALRLRGRIPAAGYSLATRSAPSPADCAPPGFAAEVIFGIGLRAISSTASGLPQVSPASRDSRIPPTNWQTIRFRGSPEHAHRRRPHHGYYDADPNASPDRSASNQQPRRRGKHLPKIARFISMHLSRAATSAVWRVTP